MPKAELHLRGRLIAPCPLWSHHLPSPSAPLISLADRISPFGTSQRWQVENVTRTVVPHGLSVSTLTLAHTDTPHLGAGVPRLREAPRAPAHAAASPSALSLSARATAHRRAFLDLTLPKCTQRGREAEGHARPSRALRARARDRSPRAPRSPSPPFLLRIFFGQAFSLHP